MFIGYLSEYIVGSLAFSFQHDRVKHVLSNALPLLGFGLSALYVYWLFGIELTTNHRLVIVVWISVIISLVLINLVQFNILHKIIYQLQHPVFMLVLATGIVITGYILKHKIVSIGGIIFAELAYVASYFDLHEQLLIESIAWLIAFVIPGHFISLKYKIG